MGSLKDLLIFAVGFAVAWIVIRFIAIKWRDSMRKERPFDFAQDDKARNTSSVRDDTGGDIIEQQAEVKGENIQKITEALKNQDQITNNEVQHLLGVSDATATRYLDELEKQGIVEQIGATGAGVIYRRK